MKTNRIVKMCLVLLVLSISISCSSSSSSKKPVVDPTTDINLPPDPGADGMKTIAGVDSDSDGVRDDVQRYIALTYPDQPEVQKVLIQGAKADQEYILSGDDPVQARENALNVDKATQCLYSKDIENRHQILVKIHAEFLNTKERILASDKVDSLLSGQMFPSAKDNATSCDDYKETP